jgi:hypothetical protein
VMGTVFSGHEISLPNVSFRPSFKGDGMKEFDGDPRLFLGGVELIGGFANSVMPNAFTLGCCRIGIQSPCCSFRRNEVRGC